MQLLELFKNQFLALLDLLVPLQHVIPQEDVLTNQLFVNQADLLQHTNAIQLLINANLLFQIVMMEMHVQLIVSLQMLDVFILHFVLLLIAAQQQLVQTDNAPTLQRAVMMETFVQLTAVISKVDHVFILQLLALVEKETLELATLKLQNVKLENHVLLINNVTITITQQLTFAVQFLDVLTNLMIYIALHPLLRALLPLLPALLKALPALIPDIFLKSK
jgi:hypothetical protein